VTGGDGGHVSTLHVEFIVAQVVLVFERRVASEVSGKSLKAYEVDEVDEITNRILQTTKRCMRPKE